VLFYGDPATPGGCSCRPDHGRGRRAAALPLASARQKTGCRRPSGLLLDRGGPVGKDLHCAGDIRLCLISPDRGGDRAVGALVMWAAVRPQRHVVLPSSRARCGLESLPAPSTFESTSSSAGVDVDPPEDDMSSDLPRILT
jgi:hypothetical protein